jgi:hypothetical protein
VDNAWEQRKLEARKMLKTATNPRRPVNAVLGRFWYEKDAHWLPIPE